VILGLKLKGVANKNNERQVHMTTEIKVKTPFVIIIFVIIPFQFVAG